VTIEKGQAWGRPGRLPDGGVVVSSDADARAVVETARRAGEAVPTLGLLGGDLCRTLGGRGDERIRSGEATVVPVDLGSVLVDGRQHWFVAHLLARRSWWRGRVVAAMNAQFIGRWDVAPRAHPGDGLLDVLDSDLGVGDRWKARSRLPAGTHVPHPAIAERRVKAVQIDFERATPVWLDGERVAFARALSIRVEPDALTCVV
jgi:hypothetical protein